MNDAHLNPTQLYAFLAAEADSVAEHHLNHCAICREEFYAIRASVANFRIAATNFAATHEPVRQPLRSRFHTRLFRPAYWISGAATAAVALAISLSVIHRPVSSVSSAQPVIAKANTAAKGPEAVSDEALLQDIDRDLSNSVPTPLQPLEVTSASDSGTPSSQN